MEPRAKIGRNHETCMRGSPLIESMGYEHRVDEVGGGGSRQWQTTTHTHTHTNTVSFVIHRVVKPRSMIRSNHDTCKNGLPLIKLMGYEHREDAVGGGESKQCQIHTHTQSIHRDTQDGWSLGQRSEAIGHM